MMGLFGSLVGVVLFTTCAHSSNLVQLRAAEDSYDYVIVGGGVSGLVVANRLSEDKSKTVLVIEAGEAYDNPNIRLPAAAAYALNETLFWPDYTSEPEPELGSKTWGARVGRVLGGGSIVNGMIYDRGSAADYDAWEELDNPGWGWEGIYPYFKKGTELLPPPDSLAKEFNITWDPEAYSDGPLKLGIADFQYPDMKDSFAAWKGAGVHMPLDGNNGEAYGASWFPNTMNPKTGERSHARNSYYEPVSERKNLKVLLGTLATELVFGGNSSSLTAKGVKITDRATNTSTTVYATKEVVLAAGAINTPKLLQLSGVGPASVLEAAGIKIRLNHEGVGANFQDHPYTMVAFNSSNASFPNPNTLATNATFNDSAWQQYEDSRTGPYTQARGNALALIPFPEIDEKNYKAVAQQVLDQEDDAYLPSIYNGSEKLIAGVKAQRKVLAALFQNEKAAIMENPIGPGPGFALVVHEKPLSRGSITLDPANPHGPPKVFYNALSNPIDKTILASLVRYIRTVFARPEFAKFTPVETAPGAQYTSDKDIIEKSVAMGFITPTFAHPGGSCAMMPEKLGGCVSPELLVYGVKGLSIVDASILPLLPSQHLQATMYAVGEKAADIIKARA